MTPEQFVFWLRGYFASNDPKNFTSLDWKVITDTLALTRVRPAILSELRPAKSDVERLKNLAHRDMDDILGSSSTLPSGYPPLMDPPPSCVKTEFFGTINAGD